MKSRHRLVLAAWVRCTALGTRASERSVAIKILPEQLSKDPTRKQRFEREAKTISSFIVGFREGIRLRPQLQLLHVLRSYSEAKAL